MTSDSAHPSARLRVAKLLQLAGAVWLFGALGLFVIGLLTRSWFNLDDLTEDWLLDVAAATRMEYNLVRFLVLAPGFALAAAGYGLRRRAEGIRVKR